MKRDMDLLRKILLEVEKLPPGHRASGELAISGEDQATLNEHTWMLYESGYIEGVDAGHSGIGQACWPTRLTMEGHDFIDSIRDDTIWEKTKQFIQGSVGTTALKVIQAAAVKIAIDSISGP